MRTVARRCWKRGPRRTSPPLERGQESFMAEDIQLEFMPGQPSEMPDCRSTCHARAETEGDCRALRTGQPVNGGLVIAEGRCGSSAPNVATDQDLWVDLLWCGW
ncbi:unnamed protein product [Durusdinium trenchii]|uniref:Apple domain-containing protein n=1 Tax=Durusdinium trenchii TaxID=1381693 RepID=A0ABP0PMQ8_9DINO